MQLFLTIFLKFVTTSCYHMLKTQEKQKSKLNGRKIYDLLISINVNESLSAVYFFHLRCLLASLMESWRALSRCQRPLCQYSYVFGLNFFR